MTTALTPAPDARILGGMQEDQTLDALKADTDARWADLEEHQRQTSDMVTGMVSAFYVGLPAVCLLRVLWAIAFEWSWL